MGQVTRESLMASGSLSDVLNDGDTLKSLERMRKAIADDLEACDSMRDKAALYLRLMAVVEKIDELSPKEAAGDAIDEIAARRDARRSSPAARANSAKRPG